MTERVKRGLGLVVVGLITYGLAKATAAGGLDDAAALLALVAVCCGLVGLAFVAWGLLRD